MNDNMYRGVIEDNNDPKKLGRVKVRIFGIHTSVNENAGADFEWVQTDQLPWATVMGSTSFGLVGGIGISSVLPKGTWVWVTLEQGRTNYPVVIGTLIGNVTEAADGVYDGGKGFCDPDGINPQKTRVEESDINRLARNEKLADTSYDEAKAYDSTDTIHKITNDNVDNVDSITDDKTGADVSQLEPNSLSDAAEYPNCTVLETQSGHVVEIDDTPDNERIKLYHKSGSFMEIRPDGTFIQKGVNAETPSHFIHMNSINEHIAMGVKRYIELNLEEIITGEVMRNIKLDLKEHIEGSIIRDTDKNITDNILGAVTITADGHLKIDNDVIITGNLKVDSAIAVDGDMTSGAEVRDSSGNLSSLRDEFNIHKHVGNLGSPTSPPLTPDPEVSASPITVTLSPK